MRPPDRPSDQLGTRRVMTVKATRRAVEEAARSMGATSVDWENGKTHIRVRATLADGKIAVFSVSRTVIDPYKLKGWTRQHINRALRN